MKERMETLRPEISLGLARRSDVVEIALMSRDLVERGDIEQVFTMGEYWELRNLLRQNKRTGAGS